MSHFGVAKRYSQVCLCWKKGRTASTVATRAPHKSVSELKATPTICYFEVRSNLRRRAELEAYDPSRGPCRAVVGEPDQFTRWSQRRTYAEEASKSTVYQQSTQEVPVPCHVSSRRSRRRHRRRPRRPRTVVSANQASRFMF